MKDNINPEFNDLIKSLEGLRSVKAPNKLRSSIEYNLLPSLPAKKRFFLTPFYFIRPLALAIIILIFMGSGIALASLNSQPGDLLYPVKTVVEGLFSKNKTENQENNAEDFSPTPTLRPALKYKGTVPEEGLSPADSDSPDIIPDINPDDTELPDTDITLEPEKILPTVIIPQVTLKPELKVEINPSPTKSKNPIDIKLNSIGLNIGL